MKWFEKKKPRETGVAVQMRQGAEHPFGMMEGYVPLRQGEMALYRGMREGIPILDAAIIKLVRLCSGFTVEADNARAQAGLVEFLQTVDTGRGQRGLQSFLDCYLDSMLTYGRGVGEMVLGKDGREVRAVLCASPDKVEIWEGESPLDVQICQWQSGALEPLPWQKLLLFTPFQPETEHPYGVSMLRSMPFMADILMKIYQAIGMNWERMGNVRFAVVCKPEEGEGAFAQERCKQMATQWSAAMQATKQGAVRDFVAVGDVDIKVIGADNQILDSEVPSRQILEQLVARTGLPPFLLGLSWSTTERMSEQQADILTSELTAMRRGLENVIERVCELWLAVHGYGGSAKVVWDPINLQDESEEAKADLYRAQAEQIRNNL